MNNTSLTSLQMRRLLYNTGLANGVKKLSIVKKIFILSIFSILLAIASVYSFIIFNQLAKWGMPELSIYLFHLLSILAILYNTVISSGDFLYSHKENEIIGALPISTSSLVKSKLFCIYIQNLLYCLILTLPIGVIYSFYFDLSSIFALQYTTSILMLPTIPILLGILFVNLSLRLNKYLIFSVIIFLVFSVVTSFSTNLTRISLNIAPHSILEINYYLRFLLPIVNIIENNIYYFGLSLLIVILILVVGFIQISITFPKTLELYQKNLKSKVYDLNQYRERKVYSEIMKKEVKAFWRSKVYLLNSIAGLLIMTVGIFSLFFFPVHEILESELSMAEDIIYYLPFVLAFINVTACPTHCTLSFEGKNFWILKSLPISATDLINGKIISFIRFIVPFILIHVIAVFWNIMSFSELKFMPILILIPIVYVFFSAVLGITLDLKFPMFDWTSEEAVVKQKITMPISMLINIISVAIPIGLMTLIPNYRMLILGISTLIIVIITVLLHKILIGKLSNFLVD